MSNTPSSEQPTTPYPIDSYTVKQALAAIELGKTDNSVFHYLQFFTSLVPTDHKAFVHVIPNMSLLTQFYAQSGDTGFSKYEIKNRLAEELAAEIDQYFTTAPSSIQYVVLEGDPLEVLLEYANDIHADLLVIGQDREKSYHGILANNLIRKSNRNVLLIPNDAPAVLTRILVPVDFSPNSKRALKTAMAINRQLEDPVRITCFHAYDLPDLNPFAISRSTADFKAIIKENVSDALEHFLEHIDPEDRAYIDTQLLLKESSNTGKYILNAAGEYRAELIIMGGLGHSKVEGLLLGSVAEKFLAINKTIPTLIVK